MDTFKIEENKPTNQIKIVVIGVGGGGSNMVDHLINSGIDPNVKLIALNTDAQALQNSLAPNKLQLGPKLTKGRGTGMRLGSGKAKKLGLI